MSETYKYFDFGFEYPSELTVQSVIDDWEGFRILISAENQRWVRIKFDGPASYRRVDEGDFLKSYDSLPRPISNAYEVFDSEFLEWFNSESLDIRKGVRHFLFLSINDVIEVLAYEPPLIELL